jgi:hypothetical protein
MPIVGRTCSGLQPCKWIGRLIDCYNKWNITHGPLFRNTASGVVRIVDTSEIFFRHLGVVQDLWDVKVMDVYGISH